MGALLLTTHLYGAYAMIFLMFIHFFRGYYLGVYKAPREFSWMVGTLLMVFTLGMGFRLAGELGFQIDATVYNIPVPYPSLEDVLSLVGFAMIFLGLFLYVRMFAKSLTRAKALGIVTVVFLATAGGYAALLGPNIVTQAPELASASLTFAFAILEVLALSTALIGFAMLSGGRVGRSWLGLIGATLLTMVSDMLFFYIFVNAATNLLAADSLLSSWAYILFALAFQLHREEFA
jgi:hypothetical protein